MQIDFLQFWTAMLKAVADFMMAEPIIYITAMICLLVVITIIKRICR